MEEITTELTWKSEQPYKIKVIKNTKGYNWEITVSGDDIEEIKKQVVSLEQWALIRYSAG